MGLPRDMSSGATCVDLTAPLPPLPPLLAVHLHGQPTRPVRTCTGSGPRCGLEADFHWTHVPLSLLPGYWYNPEVYRSYISSRMMRV